LRESGIKSLSFVIIAKMSVDRNTVPVISAEWPWETRWGQPVHLSLPVDVTAGGLMPRLWAVVGTNIPGV